MMSEFFPGQRVLCIDGTFHPSVWEYVNEVPIEGEVYTVTYVRPQGRDNITGKITQALSLREISGRLPGCESETCWIVRRFAPLDVRETAGAEREKGSRQKRRKATAPRSKRQPALA